MAPPLSFDDLREYVQRCDPYAPLEDADPRYQDFDEESPVRGSDGSAIDQLQHNLRLATPEEPRCLLFTGYPGTGKTTELRRLARRLRSDPTDPPCHVVLIDALNYVHQHVPPTITDLLRVLAYHLDREATRTEGHDADASPGYLTRFWSLLQSDVELRSTGFEAYGIRLMTEIKDNPTFRQKVEAQLRLHFTHFAQDAMEQIAEAVTRIRTATQCGRVVVLVDSLEKFTALDAEGQATMEASVESLFVSHARWLRLPCSVVYTFPLWLRFRTAGLDAHYDDTPLVLPMVKLVGADGLPHAPSVRMMTQLVLKRIRVPAAIFGDTWEAFLARLIQASGGYLRDLIRMVRDVMQKNRAFPVNSDQVDRTIERAAEGYSYASLSVDLTVLRHIAENHTLPPGESELRSASRLFDQSLVLTYRNGREWYDVHPLVLRAPHVRAVLGEHPAPRT